MDLGIAGRKALIFASPGAMLTACDEALSAEGVAVIHAGAMPADGLAAAQPVDAASPDIIVVIADAPPVPLKLDADDDQTAQLLESWELVVGVAAAYRAGLAAMRPRGWGRLIAVLPSDAKALYRDDADLQRIDGLGVLGMSKALAGEMGESGVTANCILWDARLPAAAAAHGIAGTATFLASVNAAYLTGGTLTIDGGQSEGMY